MNSAANTDTLHTDLTLNETLAQIIETAESLGSTRAEMADSIAAIDAIDDSGQSQLQMREVLSSWCHDAQIEYSADLWSSLRDAV